VTALPQPPGRLLTIGEYSALPEDEQFRAELQEGVVVMSPSPAPPHNFAAGELFLQLAPQLPGAVHAILDVDIDLEFGDPDGPGQARRPDLVVIERSALRRTASSGGLLRASEVLIVVEIVSPGSKRMDHVVKRAEYADAGIPHYWVVDLDAPVSLVNCHLAGEFGYHDGGSVTGGFRTAVPFPIELDLGRLAVPGEQV
jgi:Uma2 family endonuclease